MNASEHPSPQETAAQEASTPAEKSKTKQRDPLNLLAWAISLLMHPLPLPSIMFGLVLLFAPEFLLASSQEHRWQLLSLLFLTTFAIPALSVFTMRMFGNISSLTMTRRQDRQLPFLFVSVFYLIITYFFYTKFPPLVLVNLGLASITVSLLVLTLISLYWKISAHGIAAGGATGFLTGLTLYFRNPELILPLALLMCLSGAVLWARLYLNHHSPAEAWAGWCTGFIICAGMAAFLYPLL